jgi:fatty-acyl-CoA synthase
VRSALHNVGGWIPRRARISGDRIAVIDEERHLDYAALEARCARLAGVLGGAGIGPGDRVALLLGNRSAYLEAVFAAARLGAIAVPVNALLAPPEIRFLLEDARPGALLHEASLEETVAAAGGAGVPLRLAVGGAPDAYERALESASPVHEVAPVDPDDPMILMYTSGTTGSPKGALLPHRKTFYNSLNAELFFDLGSADRVLVVVPLFHSFGLAILSIPSLYAGGGVVLQRRFDAETVWRAVGAHGITFLGGVPTMHRDLLEALEGAPAGRFDLRSLRFLFTAGAAIPVELIRAFEARGLVLKQGFGQTETSILCCLDARDAVRKAGSVGRPVFHADVRVVTRESVELEPARWRETAAGETGEIVVHGPITMLGYWNQPEETARVLRDGWLRTGDLAQRDAEGFLTLVGRAREMYISGGENVYPAQVERVYHEHPDVREIAVVGVADARWGEVGRAFVVLAAGARLDPEALRRWGRERLAAFKVPRSFVAVDHLPRNASGKVQKHRLPEGAQEA